MRLAPLGGPMEMASQSLIDIKKLAFPKMCSETPKLTIQELVISEFKFAKLMIPGSYFGNALGCICHYTRVAHMGQWDWDHPSIQIWPPHIWQDHASSHQISCHQTSSSQLIFSLLTS